MATKSSKTLNVSYFTTEAKYICIFLHFPINLNFLVKHIPSYLLEVKYFLEISLKLNHFFPLPNFDDGNRQKVRINR